MRFDIGSLGDYLANPLTGAFEQSQAERFLSIVDTGVWAEEFGFGGYWMGEHHAGHYIVSNPQLVLAAIAGRTKRIKLGSSVSLLANRDPVLLAEDFATLDLLSNGRAILGVGSGISARAFELFGEDPADTAELCRENLELIELLWNSSDLDWSGRFRSPVKGGVQPRTRSGKSLPIVRAVGTNVESARDAGRRGHQLALMTPFLGFSGVRHLAAAYREAYRAAGHDPARMNVAGTGFLFVRPDGRKAKEQFQPHLKAYLEAGQHLAQQDRTSGLSSVAAASAEVPASQREEAFMIGSPQEVVEKLQRADEAIDGLDEIKFLCDVGALPPEEIRLTMKVFSERVMPAFKTSSSPALA